MEIGRIRCGILGPWRYSATSEILRAFMTKGPDDRLWRYRADIAEQALYTFLKNRLTVMGLIHRIQKWLR